MKPYMAKVNAQAHILATIGDVTPEDIAAVIRRALRTRNTTPFRAARDAGLPGNAIRHLLEGRDSRISRLAEICDALGLELYVGRPRVDLGNVSVVRESPSPYGAGSGTRSGRSAGGTRGEAARPRDFRDVDRDWFGQTIEPLREEYRALDRHGRALMLVRLVSAFLEIGMSPDDRKSGR